MVTFRSVVGVTKDDKVGRSCQVFLPLSLVVTGSETRNYKISSWVTFTNLDGLYLDGKLRTKVNLTG